MRIVIFAKDVEQSCIGNANVGLRKRTTTIVEKVVVQDMVFLSLKS